jgi:hypothetical protein
VNRALVCAALLAMSCESAAKHPGITVGLVTGTTGFGICQLNVADTGTCAIVGGTAALALGGITALVTLFANTHAPEPDPVLDEETRYQSVTPPPPGLPVDAGVPVVDAM